MYRRLRPAHLAVTQNWQQARVKKYILDDVAHGCIQPARRVDPQDDQPRVASTRQIEFLFDIFSGCGAYGAINLKHIDRATCILRRGKLIRLGDACR